MCDIPHNKTEELSTDRLKQVITDAARLGFYTFVFSGGEPLLRDDIFELISHAKASHMTACLTSNGHKIDDQVAGRLFEAGVDVVNISIDGPQQIHDHLRGKGAFKTAIEALENLKKHKIEATVATMVCRDNYENMPYIVEFSKLYGVTTIMFQPFSRLFVSDKSREKEFFINKKDLDNAAGIIEEVIERAGREHISINPEGYLRRIPSYLSGEPVGLRHGCEGIYDTCSIRSKGDIFPCWVINDSDKLIGNVGKTRLFDLWDSERHKRIKRMVEEGGCPGCMMSCYDEVFGPNEQKKTHLNKISKLKSPRAYSRLINRLIQDTRGIMAHIGNRYRFYRSYRGSLKAVFKRLVKRFQRSVLPKRSLGKGEISKALQEIKIAKKRLEREL